MSNYSFEGCIRLESSVLIGPPGLFDAALEFELNCVREAAFLARVQAQEDADG